MTTYRDRHLAGLHDPDPDKRAKAKAKLSASTKTRRRRSAYVVRPDVREKLNAAVAASNAVAASKPKPK